MPEDRRPGGRYLIAKDLADRLTVEMDMNELLLWPPDLFAYTSYVLSLTGAYQLVISPPRNEHWAPLNRCIKTWLGLDVATQNLKQWLTELKWQDGGLENVDELVKGLVLDSELDDGKMREGIKSTLEVLGDDDDKSDWIKLVEKITRDWKYLSSDLSKNEFHLIDDSSEKKDKARSAELFGILLKRTPPALLACWAYFYKKTVIEKKSYYKEDALEKDEANLPISWLLCNELSQMQKEHFQDLWITAQSLITMHAIADETCVGWGILSADLDEETNLPKNARDNAKFFAETLLVSKGSLAMINQERCRVIPKRHNPTLGITLRSLSSNLAFVRSSVDVVWRRSVENSLTKKLHLPIDSDGNLVASTNSSKDYISMLLLPWPLHTQTKDFREEDVTGSIDLVGNHKCFSYKPIKDVHSDDIVDIVEKAKEELKNGESIDILVLPESAMSAKYAEALEGKLLERNLTPSVLVIGVREEKDGKANFGRNAVYCKYYDPIKKRYSDEAAFEDTKNAGGTPKYIQYKHHRWRLNESQIKQYGLSQVLEPGKMWWEAIKIPQRRVSFLNLGDRMTLCHLICEDLARQDPIADLIRHAGPSMVITILLDGPQKSDRWASRYAAVLSEDPGSSVITLTSFGMVRRWNSPYRSMSRVVALWSDKQTFSREIELEEGSEAVLLTLEADKEQEMTADGREESKEHETSVFKLVDVIQIEKK